MPAAPGFTGPGSMVPSKAPCRPAGRKGDREARAQCRGADSRTEENQPGPSHRRGPTCRPLCPTASPQANDLREQASGGRDLNPRPPDPQSGALPNCATARVVRVTRLPGPPGTPGRLARCRVGRGRRSTGNCLVPAYRPGQRACARPGLTGGLPREPPLGPSRRCPRSSGGQRCLGSHSINQ